jgi:hypothetical protein
VSRKVICELSQIVKLINTRFDKEREEREKEKKEKDFGVTSKLQ